LELEPKFVFGVRQLLSFVAKRYILQLQKCLRSK